MQYLKRKFNFSIQFPRYAEFARVDDYIQWRISHADTYVTYSWVEIAYLFVVVIDYIVPFFFFFFLFFGK